MKRKLRALSQQYATALKKHLRQGPRASLQPARRLGRRAVAFGLETLDVARIHERALDSLELQGNKEGLIEWAGIFFTETVAPIERTHRAALQASARSDRLNKALGRRTADLAASNRSLKQGTAERKAVEEALKQSGEHYQTLLKESLALQRHLRHLTHRILMGQEDKRKQISHGLQDEIAQTLLGINVRLLAVKAASQHTNGFQKELASTQRLVDKSKKTIERFAREYGKLQGP